MIPQPIHDLSKLFAVREHPQGLFAGGAGASTESHSRVGTWLESRRHQIT
jgi:hypothetical protein